MSQDDKKIPKRRDVQRNPMKAPPSQKVAVTNMSSAITRDDASISKLGKTDICPRCNGFGGLESGGGCNRCDGTGYIFR
jgi:hypothetical protein